ncbi:MAG TPA: amino acid ABC transporter substrate-binding protein [Saprospiraceae bacterium]|nr:amino acid ABC transporter substrate-binding protein [Saprospiraceae bacterium]
MVSPYSASLSVTKDNPYYIQVNPSLRSHCEALTKHFRAKYPADQVVLIARNKTAETNALRYFQDANYEFEGTTATTRLKEVILTDDSPDFINNEDFSTYIQLGKTTVFVIPSWQNEQYVYSLLRKINVSKGPNNVVVYGMPQWLGFERISPDYFERLHVHISASSYIDPTASTIKFFRQDYFNRYGTVPTADVFLGYDTVLYFGRMLEKHGAKFQYFIDQEREAYLHTTFGFEPIVKATTTGAEDFSKIERFENKHLNILKFENYHFQLVKGEE